MSTDTNKEIDIGSPDTEVSVKKMFGIDSDLTIPAYKKTNDYVRVKIVDSEGDNRLENMFYLAKSILEHSRVFEYMTKKHKTALQEIVNSMLDE